LEKLRKHHQSHVNSLKAMIQSLWPSRNRSLLLAAWILEEEEERRDQAANCKTARGFPQASHDLHKKLVAWNCPIASWRGCLYWQRQRKDWGIPVISRKGL